MAERKAAPAKGKGGNTTLYVVAGLTLVGGYLYLKRRSSAAATAASNGSTGGGTIPTAITVSGGTTGPTTLAGWITQALASMTSSSYGPSAALNDLNDWLAGNCVSAAGFTAIGNVVQASGLPPGYGTTPTLTVCSQGGTSGGAGQTGGTTTTANPTVTPAADLGPGAPPSLPSQLATAMANNGESLLGGPQWDAKLNEWIFATNRGGVYNIGANGQPGGVFYGSYLGLPAAARQGPTSFAGFTINPDGTYTLTRTDGANYTFTPTTPQGG